MYVCMYAGQDADSRRRRSSLSKRGSGLSNSIDEEDNEAMRLLMEGDDERLSSNEDVWWVRERERED